MEHRAAADRAEAESESRAGVARAHVLGRMARDSVGRPEARQRGEDAAGTALAFQAMADTDATRLANHLDAQLTAATARGSDGLLIGHGRLHGMANRVSRSRWGIMPT